MNQSTNVYEFSISKDGDANLEPQRIEQEASQLRRPVGRWELREGNALERNFTFKTFKATWVSLQYATLPSRASGVKANDGPEGVHERSGGRVREAAPSSRVVKCPQPDKHSLDNAQTERLVFEGRTYGTFL
jgi:hypothetical protein